MKNWSREERYRVLKSPEEIRDLYERIKKTPYRQTYHIQPVTGLLNDPNGFVWHDGKWHLFYQWTQILVSDRKPRSHYMGKCRRDDQTGLRSRQ